MTIQHFGVNYNNFLSSLTILSITISDLVIMFNTKGKKLKNV